MAIEYGILFRDEGPDLFAALNDTALANGFELTADQDGAGYWLAGNETDFFYIRSHPPFGLLRVRSLEFSFGRFYYAGSWYVRCGPDSFGSLLVLLHVVKQLANSYEGDFVCVVNGERVVVKQEARALHVSRSFGARDEAEVQAVLAPLHCQVADYPVV